MEEANDPEREILGSVTHSIDSQNTEKAPLRTSARVSKKLRLDSQNASNQEKLQEKKNVPDKTEIKNNKRKPSKSKRINGFWSTEDKNLFFNALNEYGKDFVAIETYMNNKRTKRGISQSNTKNKDQARHFYYRTWHKISKYVKFPTDVNKVTQELYTLVNFGEFRKRMGFFIEKYAVKLNELIYLGSTQIRVKGKTLRIKTPVCRALRKLNRLEECPGYIQLPVRISVELRPRDNFTWSKLQALSMNPRVRTTLPLHSPLISLLKYLQQKWQSPDMKANAKVSPAVSTSDGKDAQILEDSTSLLRIAPKEGLNINAPVIGVGEFVTSSRVCFLSFEKKFLNRTSNVEEMLKQLNLNISRSGKLQKCKKQTTDEDKGKVTTENNESDGHHSEADISPLTFQQTTASLKKGSLDLSVKCATDEGGQYKVDAEKEEYDIDMKTEVSSTENEQISVAKAGWTVKNAELIRIGDLYLMFGNDSKLQLDYWWEDCSPGDNETISCMLQKLISVAQTISDKEKVRDLNKRDVNSKKSESKKCKTTNDWHHASTFENDGNMRPPETTQFVGGTDNATVRQDTMLHKESGMESFREQLSKLQPHYLGRRRRPGDRQKNVVSRMLHTFATPVQNVQCSNPLLPSRNNVAAIRDSIFARNSNNISNNNNSSISKVSILDNSDVANNTDLKHENNKVQTCTPSLDNMANEQVSSAVVNPSLDLRDDDTRLSNCSSITRILEMTLSNVMRRSTSSDGLTTPSIASEPGSELLSTPIREWNENQGTSAHWPCLETSNLSFSSLLAELDHAAQQFKESANSDTNSLPDDLETGFYLNLTPALYNTDVRYVAK